MTARPSLRDLGVLHDTDKVAHGYLPHYEARFGALRDEPVTLLEIGVMSKSSGTQQGAKGASLRMWCDYFPLGRIYGIDIDPEAVFSEGRMKVFHGDQADADLLARVVAETGPLDIVVDDGSHCVKDHLASFYGLWPHLKPAGWYCIEDCFSMFYACWAASDGQRPAGQIDPAEYDLPTIIDFIYSQRQAIFTGQSEFAEIHLITGGPHDGMVAFQAKKDQAG